MDIKINIGLIRKCDLIGKINERRSGDNYFCKKNVSNY